ncbi:putative acyl-CoA desaturase [Helianthus annuus]|uniref:Acyl-CoA desaturase n=1 Tax=Helianthus annuus TaxID=4232 RepID=A0A251UX89_HELAN|nr:delta-9 acyl-lipid desaturase 1 [Helianthus annuus]KAF5819094.1 putative acyl-CoA desaturase [Helianthus annuus]
MPPTNYHNSRVTKNQTMSTVDASVIPVDRKISQPSELEKRRRGGFWLREWRLVDVVNLCWITGIHVLAAFAPFVFDWGAVMVALGLALFTGIGMTLGYHRLLTHRSFKISKGLEYFFVYCGALAGQKDPISWVSTHKSHHRYAETDRDPHSPTEGFWFSHLGWFCYHDYIVAKCGEYTNVPELKAQWFYRFLNETYFLHPTILAVLLYLYGGFSYLVWGVGVRAVIVCHMTFVVRSVGHIWGERSWNTPDTSTNNWWTGILALGEGWHNNHHAFPNSARHGLEWWQLDLTWELIRFLQLIGLATDVKLPSESEKRRMVMLGSIKTN